MDTSSKCIVFSEKNAFTNIHAPAIHRLGMDAVEVDSDQMIEELRTRPPAVVIDSRNEDVNDDSWNIYSYQFVGAALVAEIPFLLINQTAFEPPASQMLASKNILALDQTSTDKQHENASKQVEEKLRKLIQVTSAPISPENHASISAPLRRPDDIFDRASAQRLMFEFLMDGLSPSTIQEELLRLGAPPSWVKSQFMRRTGW